jgi:hypothetical protein
MPKLPILAAAGTRRRWTMLPPAPESERLGLCPSWRRLRGAPSRGVLKSIRRGALCKPLPVPLGRWTDARSFGCRRIAKRCAADAGAGVCARPPSL